MVFADYQIVIANPKDNLQPALHKSRIISQNYTF